MKKLTEEINIILQDAFYKGNTDPRFKPGIIEPVIDKIIQVVKERDAYMLREGDRDFWYDSSERINFIVMDMVIEKERELYRKRQKESL